MWVCIFSFLTRSEALKLQRWRAPIVDLGVYSSLGVRHASESRDLG